MCIDSEILTWKKKGPVIGYRGFDIGPYPAKNRLQSLCRDQSRAWTREVNVTEDSPRANEDFGFHALDTLQDVKDNWLADVYAKVRGSGEIVEHRTGFRSSRMKILRLYVHTSSVTARQRAALRRYYRVPVTVLP